MPTTPTENLGIDRLDENENGVIRHNEGLNVLDALVQLAVKDRDLTNPPGSPADGDRYLVAEANLANWTDESLPAADWYVLSYYSGWIASAVKEGWRIWINDESKLVVWDGTAFRDVYPSSGGSGKAHIEFRPSHNEPPVANFATPDLRNSHPVLDFDDSVAESAVFSGTMPASYGGGNLTVKVYFAMSTATSGNVDMSVAFERIGLGHQDIDSDGFAAAQSLIGQAVPAVSGHVKALTFSFTNGQADGILAGDPFRLKVTRNAANGTDTATGDLELLRVVITED